MQSLTILYTKSLMKQKNKRIDNLMCLKNIPNKDLGDFSFEEGFEYEVLGINEANETFVLFNDWGEAEEIKISDPRFKIHSYASGKNYPTNFILGIGMNKKNQWHWFQPPSL